MSEGKVKDRFRKLLVDTGTASFCLDAKREQRSQKTRPAAGDNLFHTCRRKYAGRKA